MLKMIRHIIAYNDESSSSIRISQSPPILDVKLRKRVVRGRGFHGLKCHVGLFRHVFISSKYTLWIKVEIQNLITFIICNFSTSFSITISFRQLLFF